MRKQRCSPVQKPGAVHTRIKRRRSFQEKKEEKMALKNSLILAAALFSVPLFFAGCATIDEVESLRAQVKQAVREAEQARQEARLARAKMKCCTEFDENIQQAEAAATRAEMAAKRAEAAADVSLSAAMDSQSAAEKAQHGVDQ
jgi:hypothetical protein